MKTKFKNTLALLCALQAFSIIVPANAAEIPEEYLTREYLTKWWDTLNDVYAVKYEKSNEVYGLKDFTNAEAQEHWDTTQFSGVTNELSFIGDVLKIKHTCGPYDNWNDIIFSTVNLHGGTNYYFGDNQDTIFGQYINMLGNVKVQMTVKTDTECNFSVDLLDINGHRTAYNWWNNQTIPANTETVYTYTFPKYLWDLYGGKFYDINNGRYNPSRLIIENDTIILKQEEKVPFDPSRITGILLHVNYGSTNIVTDQEINIEISDIIIGDEYTAESFITPTVENIDNGKLIYDESNVTQAKYEWDYIYNDNPGIITVGGTNCTDATVIEYYKTMTHLTADTQWYSFTPNEDAEYVVSNNINNYNISLVITDNCQNSENIITEGNFGPLATKTYFEGHAGTTYYLSFKNAAGQENWFNWDIQQVAGSTNEYLGPICEKAVTTRIGQNLADISNGKQWFSFVPTVSGKYTASSCYATFKDTKVWVYDTCSNFAEALAFNDDSCSQQAAVSFTAEEGNEYYIKWELPNREAASFFWELSQITEQDTVTVNDTVIIYDTITEHVKIIDTILVYDSISICSSYDTIPVFDTVETIVPLYDTITIMDTITELLTRIDSITVYDTLNVEKLVFDTLPVYDTTLVELSIFDTVQIFDTTAIKLNIYDTIPVYDTIVTIQTLYDTVQLFDTTVIEKIMFDTVFVHTSVSDTLEIQLRQTGISGNESLCMKLYPNPAKDVLYIEMSEASESGNSIIIRDNSSNILFNSKIDTILTEINTAIFQVAGVYTVQILNDQTELLETKYLTIYK